MANILGFIVPDWAAAIGFFVGAILLADVIIVFVDRLVRPLLSKTKTVLDDYLFDNLRGPFKLVFAIFGAYYGLQLASPNVEWFGYKLDALMGFALIIAAGHAAARALSAVLKWYVHEIGIQERSRVGDVFPILSNILKIAVYLGTFIILLSEWGVEIGPLIAGLGVAGIAVALALQDTLKNFFAGLYILADKPVRRGDFVAVDTDMTDNKGWIEEIGWRTTKLRTRDGYLYLIPNDKLASSVVINYNKSRSTKRVRATVGAEYSAEPKYVMDTLEKACKEVIKRLEYADKDEKPVIRLTGYKDSAIEYTASIYVKEYENQFEALSELNQEIHRQFKNAGLTIPFPIRTLYMHDEKKDGKKKAGKPPRKAK